MFPFSAILRTTQSLGEMLDLAASRLMVYPSIRPSPSVKTESHPGVASRSRVRTVRALGRCGDKKGEISVHCATLEVTEGRHEVQHSTLFGRRRCS
ncbi:hypothetical protein FA13DRAFT_1734399 [Coprinellus micaceus]|uniref:Uncharacterized protein n=1 Tax=Coprinellus micaceus TaxID=71717 RepID=A0A4Y7T618_COPMI|nr:hypothetical protein FA13DRAFT_1734399 [Coprinellus micaceus]